MVLIGKIRAKSTVSKPIDMLFPSQLPNISCPEIKTSKDDNISQDQG
jgi:hypothetical protein